VDVVFDKNVIFLSFLLKMLFFYETYPHSSDDTNRMHEARIYLLLLFKSRGSVLSFDILHVQIFVKNNNNNKIF